MNEQVPSDDRAAAVDECYGIEQRTSETLDDSLSLKWGTLKSWDIHSETGLALLKRYFELGSSLGAMQQRDTPEQKDIICQLIDGCAGDIYLDWDGEYVSKEKAKEYVRNYR